MIENSFSEFSDTQRRTLVLVRCYEQIRRDSGQFGYRMFQDPKPTPEVFELQQVKQCAAVIRFLDEFGWRVTWNEVHWQGFIRFAFDAMRPNIPLPGQLCNRWLLRKYLRCSAFGPESELDPRSFEEMVEIYDATLDEELREHGGWRVVMGVAKLG